MDRSDLDAPSTLARLRRLTWWSSVGVALAAGATYAGSLLLADLPPGATIAALGATGAASLGAAWLLRQRLGRAATVEADPPVTRNSRFWRVSLLAVAGAVLVGVVVGPTDQAAWWPLVPGLVVAALAVSVPRGWRLSVVGAGSVLVAAGEGAATWAAAGAVDVRTVASVFVLVTVIGGAMISQLWMWDVAERLDAVRRMSAELAVADERLRFASDLHDVQGHHLQVIALKSELAARLAEIDPRRAAAEMRELHDLAQTALRDTREVVQGYRRPPLETELANATRVLSAAGIDCRRQRDPEAVIRRLAPAGRQLLGSVVREATTNVLRHSRARHASVRLLDTGDTVRLEVSNDGAKPGDDGAGTGLHALAERLAAVDGSLDWRREGAKFTVTASVPVGASGEVVP